MELTLLFKYFIIDFYMPLSKTIALESSPGSGVEISRNMNKSRDFQQIK
jgi:hypothetical protein